MKVSPPDGIGIQQATLLNWESALRTRSFHVEFPEDEETPATHTVSVQRDFVRKDGGLNLEHRFWRSGGYVEFLINDRFHAILSLRWMPLVALVFITVVICAAILSMILFLATEGKAEECLGASNSQWDYFFFVVETMFAIGYGSPRYPSCRVSSFMVTPIVVTGVLLNSLILGLVFQKFSSAAKRKWALAFTEKLVVSSGEYASSQRRSSANGFIVDSSTLTSSPPHRPTVEGIKQNPAGPSKAPLQEPLLQGIPEVDCNKGNLKISFRVLNITETSFFNPRLALYLLVHRRGGLSIRQFSIFHTDTPLEFMALPITVTVDQNDAGSPLRDVTEAQLRSHGHCYELLVLLSFTDNRTSRTVEVSKSWRLSTAVWNETFVPIVRQSGPQSSRAFEIDVDNLSGQYGFMISPVVGIIMHGIEDSGFVLSASGLEQAVLTTDNSFAHLLDSSGNEQAIAIRHHAI
ncbi:hypothetical protein cyc_05329 [Cyclospora cayetanensis]|uniref:Inward rectifier potassium channel C-terminal domain-containing protein n=1 Tax=Cyclospora cayetanensis TaxID=88456 RepID=A0A1D3D914_9EIME|nr:hypothetical protein cyc_05329 [Cyclospora cayetanensis]